jgi:hypothetical protein
MSNFIDKTKHKTLKKNSKIDEFYAALTVDMYCVSWYHHYLCIVLTTEEVKDYAESGPIHLPE